MDKLEIYGVLELDNDPDKDGNQRSYTLNATVDSNMIFHNTFIQLGKQGRDRESEEEGREGGTDGKRGRESRQARRERGKKDKEIERERESVEVLEGESQRGRERAK